MENADLPIFFAFEQDPVAIHMAAFTAEDPSDRAAFDAHWARNRANERNIMRTILVDGQVAGHLAHFEMFDQPQVSYWLRPGILGPGRRDRRPGGLPQGRHAAPAIRPRGQGQPGTRSGCSRRTGSVIVDKDKGFANGRGAEVEEVILRLD